MLKDDERFDRLIKEGIDIIQSKSVFSFSLDAVLLANFAKLPKNKNARIVDACCGNGAVAFMLCPYTNATIFAIEYQAQLADMAKRTIQHNQLEHKITVIHDDYKNVEQWIKPDSVDVITCNPPYFKWHEQSIVNINDAYTIARHEMTLSLEEWVRQSSRLLKFGGKLFCVHRPERLDDLLTTLTKYHLAPKHIQFVHPRANKNANIVLIEAIKNGKSNGVIILPPITVYDDHDNYLEPVRSMLFDTTNTQ